MDNQLKSLIENSGRFFYDSSNNKTVNIINDLLKKGFINIMIAPNGEVYECEGHKGNIIISGYNLARFYSLKNITASNILNCILKFITDEKVKDLHKKTISKSVNNVCECRKCGGWGKIPYFHYYADGVCFECHGSGWIVEKTKVNI